MLLCLVNDVLDIKMIKKGIYEPKLEAFSPKETLDFIVAIFMPLCQSQQTKLDYSCVDQYYFDSAAKFRSDWGLMP